MKSSYLSLLFVGVVCLMSFALRPTADLMTDTFKVYGNAACKDQIEELIVTVHGVESAEWDADTQLMKVVYNENIVTRHQFFSILAEAGYDNKGLRAKDSFYEALSEACKYERSAAND